MEQRTIVAISTAAGNSAIGVVRLSGASSHAIASEMFRAKNPAKPNGYEARFGVLFDASGPIDEAIALYFYAPNSYTGEDVVEFSCHGNPQLLNRVVQAAVSLGAVQAVAGEFSRRAFMSGKLSLSKAEAVGALISGEGRRAAAAASNALCGLLGRELSEIASRLRDVAATVAAACDYPEDTDLDTGTIIEKLRPIRQELLRLSSDAELVQAVDGGINTVIIGRPNAGKSTVLNMLCGHDRAIVSPVAGTTRDVINEHIEIGDYRLVVSDTAGIHQTDDAIELEGIRRSRATLAEAQLAIVVFDSTTRYEPELCEMVEGINSVAIINKTDIGSNIKEDMLTGFSGIVSISAINPGDRNRLIETIINVLPKLPKQDIVPVSKRQADAARRASYELDQAIECLELGIIDVTCVRLEDAYSAVCDMLLLNPTDEIVDAIFANFCIGK